MHGLIVAHPNYEHSVFFVSFDSFFMLQLVSTITVVNFSWLQCFAFAFEGLFLADAITEKRLQFVAPHCSAGRNCCASLKCARSGPPFPARVAAERLGSSGRLFSFFFLSLSNGLL